jgi:hypothetical protein
MPEEAAADDGLPYAVIVSTSKDFHNYRHVSNALSVYHAVRTLGIPDSRIILMLGGDVPCDPRNAECDAIYNSNARDVNLYPSGEKGVEADYKGADVTVEALLGVITDRLPAGTLASQRCALPPRRGAASRFPPRNLGPPTGPTRRPTPPSTPHYSQAEQRAHEQGAHLPHGPRRRRVPEVRRLVGTHGLRSRRSA